MSTMTGVELIFKSGERSFFQFSHVGTRPWGWNHPFMLFQYTRNKLNPKWSSQDLNHHPHRVLALQGRRLACWATVPAQFSPFLTWVHICLGEQNVILEINPIAFSGRLFVSIVMLALDLAWLKVAYLPQMLLIVYGLLNYLPQVVWLNWQQKHFLLWFQP